MRLPLLILHGTTGTLGMLSGFVAMLFRKGSHRHRIAGNVFVIAMLSLSASGVYPAFMKSQPGNVSGRHPNVLSGSNGMLGIVGKGSWNCQFALIICEQ